MNQENNEIAFRLVLDDAPNADGSPKPSSEVKPGAVWRLIDPETGKIYFGKIATPSEVEMTKKAAALPLPKDGSVAVANVLASGKDNMPAALDGKVTFSPGTQPSHTQFLIVEAVPQGATLGQLSIGYTHQQALEGPLRGKPITADEYKEIIETVKRMNESGVRHHDMLSNTAVMRDADGKLRVHIYDFEPDSFTPLYKGQAEDVSQIVQNIEKMSRYGTLEVGAKEQLLAEYTLPERVTPPNASMEEQAQQRRSTIVRPTHSVAPTTTATPAQIQEAQKHIARYEWEQAATRNDSIARISIEGMPPEEITRIQESLRTLGLDPQLARSSTMGETIRITGIPQIIKLEDHVFEGKAAMRPSIVESQGKAPSASPEVVSTEADAFKQTIAPDPTPRSTTDPEVLPHESTRAAGKTPATPIPPAATKATVSVRGMGTALALYNIVHGSENRAADKEAGGAQKAFSDGALALNITNIAVDVADSSLALAKIAKPLSGISQSALATSRAVPIVGTVLAIGAGALEVGAADAAGDGFRKAEAAGATAGGIIGAIGAGAAAGAIVGSPAFGVGAVPGAIIGGIVGLAGGLFGAWVGGKAGRELLGEDWQANLDREGQKVREQNIAELSRIKGKFEHNSSLVKAYGEAHKTYGEHPEDPKTQKAFEDATRAMQNLKPMSEEEKKSLAALEQALVKDYQKLAALKLPEGHPEAAARREEGGRKLEESLNVIQAIKGMDEIVPTMKKESEAVTKDTAQQNAQIQANTMVRPIEGVAHIPQSQMTHQEEPRLAPINAAMPQVNTARSL